MAGQQRREMVHRLPDALGRRLDDDRSPQVDAAGGQRRTRAGHEREDQEREEEVRQRQADERRVQGHDDALEDARLGFTSTRGEKLP